jgi:hypothetical protein
MPGAAWIIDETVEAINAAATEIVREEDAYAAYRDGLEDGERMAAYDALRKKFFLPVRPLEHYLSSLEETGLRIVEVSQLPIEAHVDQWFEFLSAYHEGVLGWVGGSARVEGEDPAPEAIEDRLHLLWQSMERVFGGRPSFEAVWTYITAERAAA